MLSYLHFKVTKGEGVRLLVHCSFSALYCTVNFFFFGLIVFGLELYFKFDTN